VHSITPSFHDDYHEQDTGREKRREHADNNYDQLMNVEHSCDSMQKLWKCASDDVKSDFGSEYGNKSMSNR
jgi:hypothetical protein